MVLKILLTVGYWLYALIVFISSLIFVKETKSPIGYDEGRIIVAIFANELAIGCGFLLTVMFWTY